MIAKFGGVASSRRSGAMESTAAVRLPAPLSDFHRRHPDVTVELHIGSPQQMMAQVLTGELDAALVAEPVVDAKLESRPIYDEESVIVPNAAHPPIRSPRDLTNRTMLAFHPGCPHRKRLAIKGPCLHAPKGGLG